jgi:hypothetical protein
VLDELLTIEELVDELMEEDLELDVAELTKLDELVEETDELTDTLEELLTTELDVTDDTKLVDDKLVDDCLLDELLDGFESPSPPPPQAVKQILISGNIQINFNFILQLQFNE